jgi:hypothetical protein
MAPTKKGGSGIIEGLWTGTAVFAAVRSRTFTGFITSFLIYAVILILFLVVAMWVLKSLGLQMREKMTDIGALPCPPGQSEGMNEAGERVCRAANSTYVYPTPSSKLSA